MTAAPAEPDPLPLAYAPFLPVLERLSEPLLRIVQGQLAQFERLVRDFGAPEMAEQGEFEGLGGLTSRGDVAHILQSEWLLRTEAPLEFLRRLAESETVYLEKQYADPGAKLVYRAMISIGPGLLGHGRIVALAAIFFLARIAHERNAAFHWCLLPAKEGVRWFDEVSVSTVKRFLRAVSYREMTPDDRAAAEALWESLETRAGDTGRVRRLDWVIGADRRGPASPGDTAIRTAANALSFALLAPAREEPRSALMIVRQKERERARAAIVFPDDRVCVSALENPFRPLKPPAAGGTALGPAIPAMGAWEPDYLITPNAHVRIVRTGEGLLVLRYAKEGFTEIHFVPLPKGMHLAGVQMYDRMLSLLVHSVQFGQEMLSYGQFRLLAGQKPQLVLKRSRLVPSQHLFEKRRPYAIPTLSIGEGAEFYSVSGQAYHLTFRPEHRDTGFTPLYKASKTLYSNGAYRVAKMEERGMTILRVLKHRHTRVDDYPLPQGVGLPDAVHGMTYSGGDRSLAYSTEKGVWKIPSAALSGGAPAMPPQELRLAPQEALLTAKTRSDGVTAWIWSDARYGGDGTISTVRVENGVMRRRQPPIELGDDAMAIAQVRLSDGGLWALTVDAEGVPVDLLHYRPQKRDHRFQRLRFPLEYLRAKAVEIGLEQLRG